VGDDVPVDSETLLVTNFVNLKIKSAQSFEYAHRGMLCMCVFIGVSAHTCMSTCVYTVFLKTVVMSSMATVDKNNTNCWPYVDMTL
jgi:hypothetical protein